MNIGLLLVIVLILLLVGAFPSFGYNAHWGYHPVSVLGIVLIIVVILILTGRI